MGDKILTLLKLSLGWPITLLAFFFIAKLISDKTSVFSFHLTDINILFLLLGIACFFAYFLLRALLWQKIILSKNYPIAYKEATFLWSISEIRRFIPGNIWSFATRIFLFSEKNIPKKTVVFAMVQEAQNAVLGCALFSLFSLSFLFYNLFPMYLVTPLLFISYSILIFTAAFYIYKNPTLHLRYLSISFSAFFFFSLGTYFTIISAVALSPYYFLTFLSFFSLSYFAGYLSLITPMGLGVREGVMTFGLARFIPLELAGFAAIYARVVLIFTELLFFFFIRTWRFAKHPLVTRLERFTSLYWREIMLALAIGIYIAYFTAATFARYDNFYAGRFDLGNMSQTVWNTSQNRVFQLTDPDGTEVISRLAFHADFFLIFLSPLYKLWSTPKLLLLVQTVLLGGGAYFVYQLAAHILKNKTLSLLFALSFLLYPAVAFANLYDFHSVTLASTFLLGAFYFLLKEKYLFFILFSFLAGSTKENIWVIVSLFGLYIFYKQTTVQKRMFGLVVFFTCALVFYYLVWHAIPDARGGSHFALSYYSDFGETPTSVLKNLLLSPQKILGTILQHDRIGYIYQLFSPLGFLPLLSPFFLIFTLPDFFISFLSNNAQLRQIYYHYSAAITPFLFIGSIFAAQKIKKSYPLFFRYLPFYLVFTTLWAAYFIGPLPGAKNPNTIMFTEPQINKDIITTHLSQIHKNKSVAATNNIGSHLSHRQKIYTIPLGIAEADVLVFLLNDPFAQPSLEAQKTLVEELKKDTRYKIMYEKDDFIILEKSISLAIP